MRKIWAALVCLIIVGLSIGGIAFNGDIYDPGSPIYEFVGRITPQEDLKQAESYGKMIKAKDIAGLTKDSVLPLADNFPAIIAQISGLYPSGEPVAVAPIQYSRSFNTDGGSTAVIVVNHKYSDGSVVFTTTVIDKNTKKVQKFTFNKLSAADLVALRFKPWKANGTQIFVLSLVMAEFGLSLFTLYACLANPVVRWKILWFVFICGGVGLLSFGWGNQVLSTELVHVHWGVSGYWQNLFEPVTLYLTFPLGVVVYWLRHGRKKSEQPAVSPPAA